MEPVNPMAVQLGAVLGQCQRLGLEPPYLGRRGRPPNHDLAHDRIMSETVGIAHIPVSSQPPNTDCRTNPSSRWIVFLLRSSLAAVGTELRTQKLYLHAAVEIDLN